LNFRQLLVCVGALAPHVVFAQVIAATAPVYTPGEVFAHGISVARDGHTSLVMRRVVKADSSVTVFAERQLSPVRGLSEEYFYRIIRQGSGYTVSSTDSSDGVVVSSELKCPQVFPVRVQKKIHCTGEVRTATYKGEEIQKTTFQRIITFIGQEEITYGPQDVFKAMAYKAYIVDTFPSKDTRSAFVYFSEGLRHTLRANEMPLNWKPGVSPIPVHPRGPVPQPETEVEEVAPAALHST
jgi:hypothetical protein